MNHFFAKTLFTFIFLLIASSIIGQRRIYWSIKTSSSDYLFSSDIDDLDITSTPVDYSSLYHFEIDEREDEIYWARIDPDDDCVIIRTDLEGKNLENILCGLTLQEAWGLTIDTINNKLYLSEAITIPANRYVYKCNLDGSDLVEIKVDDRIISMDIDAVNNKLYWITAESEIRSSDLNFENINTLSGNQSVIGIGDIELDLKHEKLYWSEYINGKIFKSDLNGWNKEEIININGNISGIALDLIENKIYWIDEGNGKIQKANLDGTNIESFIQSQVSGGLIDLELKKDFISPIKYLISNSYKVNIFPNPSNEYINVKSNIKSNYSVTIRNLLGEIVFNSTFFKDNIQIETNEFPLGIYQLTIENKKGARNKLFSVIR